MGIYNKVAYDKIDFAFNDYFRKIKEEKCKWLDIVLFDDIKTKVGFKLAMRKRQSTEYDKFMLNQNYQQVSEQNHFSSSAIDFKFSMPKSIPISGLASMMIRIKEQRLELPVLQTEIKDISKHGVGILCLYDSGIARSFGSDCEYLESQETIELKIDNAFDLLDPEMKLTSEDEVVSPFESCGSIFGIWR